MTVRVLIADDQSIVRAGLSTILDGQPGIEVVGQAADGREAVDGPRTDERGIAQELHISLSTVKFHLAGLMTKLGARNRVELVMWAYETKRVR